MIIILEFTLPFNQKGNASLMLKVRKAFLMKLHCYYIPSSPLGIHQKDHHIHE